MLLTRNHPEVLIKCLHPEGISAISRGSRSAPPVNVASFRSDPNGVVAIVRCDPVGVDDSRGASHPVVSLRSTTG